MFPFLDIANDFDGPIYAVGDIHGRLDLLKQLLTKVHSHINLNDFVDYRIVFLGDYIDRGPHSMEVLMYLSQLQDQKYVFLKGNHELMFQAYVTDSSPPLQDMWFDNGGQATLKSFGVDPKLWVSARSEIIEKTKCIDSWWSNLRLSFCTPQYFLVHAGINPNKSLTRQDELTMLFIRDEFIKSTTKYKRIIVHGHTPVLNVDIQPNRINIDTKAYESNKLSAVFLSGNTLEIIQT